MRCLNEGMKDLELFVRAKYRELEVFRQHLFCVHFATFELL